MSPILPDASREVKDTPEVTEPALEEKARKAMRVAVIGAGIMGTGIASNERSPRKSLRFLDFLAGIWENRAHF